MGNTLKLKNIYLILIFSVFFFFGQTAFAWVEYPTNPVYDPVVSAEKAYYPSVIKMSISDYRMWYQSNSMPSNTTIAYATSIDGLSWIMATSSVSGLISGNAGHPHVEYFDGKFQIWYWNAATPYGNTAMHHAESVDGIIWTNDSAITGNLTTTASGQWNSGVYGTVDVIFNDNPTNTGTNPFDYKYAMYYDATSGGYEQIALGYSVDGVDWTLYGTGPVVPKGSIGSWDSGYVAIGSTVIKGNFWTMWYSGGVSASNEGIGCATSVDGLEWVKCPNNPIMSKNDGVAWRNSRTYTPKIVRDGDIYKMWFTGRDVATGNYAIGYATSDLQSVSGNLYLKKKSSGEASLPINATNIVLDSVSDLNLASIVNTASGGTIIIADVINTLSSFTNGDLTNVDLSTSKNIGGRSITVGKAIKLTSGLNGVSTRITNSEIANVDVAIPDATTILAPTGWDGIITPPKTGITVGDTVPSGFSIGTAIDIGSPTEVLLFDKAVQVTLSGVTGSVGYKPAGLTTWTQITTACGGTYDEPTLSALAFPGECFVTNGIDTKILTYHLTSFGELISTLATLRVEKAVVGGTAVASDFTVNVKTAGNAHVSGSPAAGAVVPGTSYSLAAGTYTVSEDPNSSYTSLFGTDCAIDGTITLAAGDNKLCTIINTNIPVVPIPITYAAANYGVPLPLINITKIPSPLALPLGSGLVTYIYAVTNTGVVAMSHVSVKDDFCSSVEFVSGDSNNDSALDINETWIYQCTKMISKTETNIATVKGSSNGWEVFDTANVTVVVGAPLTPPLIHLVKKPNTFILPSSGGSVTYTYTVTNPGTEPLSDVGITDDKCTGLPGRVVGHPGDLNKNNLLESNEIWFFTCQSNITQTTTNTGIATGHANGLIAVDTSPVTVVVSAVVPGFPETGISSIATKLSGASPLQLGSLVFVGSRILNVRQEPSLSSSIVGQMPIQAQGTVIGDSVQNDGYTWTQVQYQNSLLGWSATAGLVRSGFKIGDKVVTIREMNVRKGASTRENILVSKLKDSSGVIMSGPIQRDGYIWWQVIYDGGVTGWTAEIGLNK